MRESEFTSEKPQSMARRSADLEPAREAVATAQRATSAGTILQMQRECGNRYVQRMLYVARKAEGGGELSPEVEQSIQAARGGGQALDSSVRARMEPAFGADFGGVRVHADGHADNLNRSLSARAFTTGQDIFFKQGEYSPGSSGGRELLAHELTHVVQQNGDQVQTKLTLGAPGDIYEQEADSVARAVLLQEQQSAQQQARFEGERSKGSLQAKVVDGRAQRQLEKEGGDEEPMQMKAGEDSIQRRIEDVSEGRKQSILETPIYITRPRISMLSTAVQRDLAIEPTTPNRRVRNLSSAQIQDAIRFNQARHTNAVEIALLRDILGISRNPAVIDEDFVQALVRYQAQFGLSQDGRLGGVTANRLAREITAEAANLGPGNLGSLAPEFQLKTDLQALVNASNTTYTDYRNTIRAATIIQRQVALLDNGLLQAIESILPWNQFARCVELLGRTAPTFGELRQRIRANLAAAWAASNPAINPPVTTQHEEGGWIYMNLLTDDLTVRVAPAGAGASINLSAPPNVAHSIVVGMFHTHPNLGPGWTAGPSPQDQTLDANDGVPDIVVGSPTNNPAVFQTFLSGPNRRRHLAGNRGLPGATGGLAPQARADGSLDER